MTITYFVPPAWRVYLFQMPPSYQEYQDAHHFVWRCRISSVKRRP